MDRAALWTAHLYSGSARYEEWLYILGATAVALKSPASFAAKTWDGKTFDAYELDVDQLSEAQRLRLIRVIAHKFGAPAAEVASAIAAQGFPIRAEDVTLAFSMRSFL